MKKIGTLTPIWNQETFIKPHFDMLTSMGLDRHVVLMQKGPLPNYHKEHGYGKKADLSRQILEDYFPQVEIYDGNYPTTEDFAAGLYNEGLELMQECDIVLRLDPDMLFTHKDFKSLIEFIEKTDSDCFQMDFAKDSINYYMTGDYEHGLKDAQESDALAVSPKKLFTEVLNYPAKNPKVIKIDGWMCHHFRGWQKPKSTPKGWDKMVSPEYIKQYSNKGKWFVCPDEIRRIMENWLVELDDLKNS